MICSNGHEMELEEVESVPAHQGFSADGSGIIDASYTTAWVCNYPGCDADIEPYIKEEPDDEREEE